jgi:hypothetical protein
MRWTWWLAILLVALVAASVWYLQAPPRTVGSYRDRAASTTEALRSQVQTARLWVGALEDGDATRPAASVAFREAEADAEAALSRFAGYKPPDTTDELRSEVTVVGREVTLALAALKLAADRGEWDDLPRLADPLEPLARRLQALERATER